MSGIAELIFPSGSTLAGWWRQLGPLQPLAAWVAHLFVHRVEATVAVSGSRPLERGEALLLRAAAGNAGSDSRPLVPLPEDLLRMIFRRLVQVDLVRSRGEEGWRLTDAGRETLASGRVPLHQRERRVFPFVECLGASLERIAAPQYLPLASLPARPWHPSPTCAFDLALLDQAMRQPFSWKETFHFPADVHGRGPQSTFSDWREAAVIKPERYLAFVLELADDPLPLRAYAVRSETMTPVMTTPLFALPASARTALRDFLPEGDTQEGESGQEFRLVGDGPVRRVRKSG